VALPSRGEVWLVDLGDNPGLEQGKRRPAVVVSVDRFNHGAAGLIVVVPITTTFRKIPMHIEVYPPEGGLEYHSFIQCDQPRCISRVRLVHHLGAVAKDTMEQVEDRLRVLLGL
jgi:mRNA interferase MazF